MSRIILGLVTVSLLLTTWAYPAKLDNLAAGTTRGGKKATTLWREPSDIRTRDLFHGPGARGGQPRAPFRFVEEDRDGGSPKFIVTDARGVRWKVKLGDEARPETAATRLLWAVGYFVDVNYYLPSFRVAGLRKLSRGQKYVSKTGLIRGGRFEHAPRKLDDWSWFDNPFIGTREFDGLRVMMALMNNWDLKKQNNAIYSVGDRELRYVVSDLGGTFGRTGGDWTRSKGDVADYVGSRFIDEANHKDVDLVLHSRPPLLYAVVVPYYMKRTRMEKVSEDLPRAHAKWIGQWLARLSNSQIRDAFRAAGYVPGEADAYTRKVRERINQLNGL